MPGELERLDASIFDAPALRVLHVGAAARELVPGAFVRSKLERITVDATNEDLATDGTALYTADGAELVALAVFREHYAVADGCKAVAEKGFSCCAGLRELELPESIERLGPFSLGRTGISSFAAPENLVQIEAKAFFHCERLREVDLGHRLECLGDEAFSGTALSELRLPASIREVGAQIARGTGVKFSGRVPSFSIEKGSTLFTSAAGGLYRTTPAGLSFVRLMEEEAGSYTIADGVRVVEERAFSCHRALREVFIPEGVTEIGRAAFRGCHELHGVHLPSTLVSMGDEAFLDTSIAEIELPASLEHMGYLALVSNGAHHGKEAPSLRRVKVDCGSQRFYMEHGLLCERGADGDRVLVHTGSDPVVVVPASVRTIASYAFGGARGIRELHLSDAITDVEIGGLKVDCFIERIHIDLVQPVDGHDSLDICFPPSARSAHELALALGVPAFVDVETIMRHYDDAVVNSHDYGDAAPSASGVGTHEQARRIVERLQDPVLLQDRYRSSYEAILRTRRDKICVAIARADDRRLFDALLDMGYIDAGNIDATIEAVSVLRDAAMTGYLLEAKRRRFGMAAIDFEL